jgi:hypothetical protein
LESFGRLKVFFVSEFSNTVLIDEVRGIPELHRPACSEARRGQKNETSEKECRQFFDMNDTHFLVDGSIYLMPFG